MFEPLTPESKTNPPDHKPDGREEWVAGMAIEIRCDTRLMMYALEWDAEKTGAESIFAHLAEWTKAQYHLSDSWKSKATEVLKDVMQELADEYADQVLWPEYLKKLKNGDLL